MVFKSIIGDLFFGFICEKTAKKDRSIHEDISSTTVIVEFELVCERGPVFFSAYCVTVLSKRVH